jgi:regulator of protease activity HflC (stomatin/prohibitin superfamily)
MLVGCPKYNVWQQGLAGEAKLARASQERKILVEQAQAEKEAAGVRAEAIQIVGQAAKDFPEYRYQEFLGAFAEALNNGNIDKIIFVPTEANIPIVQMRRDSEID